MTEVQSLVARRREKHREQFLDNLSRAFWDVVQPHEAFWAYETAMAFYEGMSVGPQPEASFCTVIPSLFSAIDDDLQILKMLDITERAPIRRSPTGSKLQEVDSEYAGCTVFEVLTMSVPEDFVPREGLGQLDVIDAAEALLDEALWCRGVWDMPYLIYGVMEVMSGWCDEDCYLADMPSFDDVHQDKLRFAVIETGGDVEGLVIFTIHLDNLVRCVERHLTRLEYVTLNPVIRYLGTLPREAANEAF